MRRITLALLLLVSTAWAAPSQAQWWGGWGGGRPAGFCGPWACPGGGWARPGRVVLLVPARRPWAEAGGFGPGHFVGAGAGAGPGWGWRRWAPQRLFWQRWAWQREMRLRRIENWHRWVEADRRGEGWRGEEPAPRFRAWARPPRFAPEAPAAAVAREEPRRPAREERRAPAEAAVALMPATPAAMRLARPAARAVPSRILAAAAMIRHPAAPAPRPAVVPAVLAPAVVRVPEPPARPANAALRRPHTAGAPERRGIQPVALRPAAPRPAPLRSQPAPAAATPAGHNAQPAAPPIAVPAAVPATVPVAAEPASPADVPVAPLD